VCGSPGRIQPVSESQITSNRHFQWRKPLPRPGRLTKDRCHRPPGRSGENGCRPGMSEVAWIVSPRQEAFGTRGPGGRAACSKVGHPRLPGARSPRLLCGIKPGAQFTTQPDGGQDCAVKKRFLWSRRQLRRPLGSFVTWGPVGRATIATDSSGMLCVADRPFAAFSP
jgi:hypothetical protein